MSPKGARILAWLGALWLACLAAGGEARAQEGPTDAIIARVNGEAVMLSQLKEAALDQEVPLESLALSGIGGEGYRKAITQLVDETLLVQKATADEIKVNDMEIARQVDLMIRELRDQLGGQAELDQFLETRRLSLDTLKRLMIHREQRRALTTQVVAKRVNVDPDKLEKFRQARLAASKPVEELNVSQILIGCPLDDQGTKKGEEKYLNVLKLAREAGAKPGEFAELARRHSDDADGRARGGWLGWLDPEGLLPALRNELAKMRPGDISAPIASDLGYHILYLVDRRTTRDLCYAEEFERQREALIKTLRETASIKLYDLQGKPLE